MAEADFGNLSEAKKRALASASVGRGIDTRETTSEARVLSCDLDRASSLAEELRERFPLNRPLNAVSLPTIFATVELQRGNPQKAIEILRPGNCIRLLRILKPGWGICVQPGFGAGKDAEAEFRKVINHPGIVTTSQRHPLAHLGLARALVIQGRNCWSPHGISSVSGSLV